MIHGLMFIIEYQLFPQIQELEFYRYNDNDISMDIANKPEFEKPNI